MPWLCPGISLVGSYIYSDKADNPATYLPYMSDTTWVQTAAGRVLIGAGTADSGTVYNAGDTGGEEKHQLTVEELATHSHGFVTAPIIYANIKYGNDCINPNTGGGACAPETRSTTSTGKNVPHENRMPYLAVYIWNRTR